MTPRSDGEQQSKRVGPRSWVGIVLLCLVAASCVGYDPRPISPVGTLDDFVGRRLDGPELAEFLRTSQGIADWPPPAWDLHALTLAAFYYSPMLDVARAQWGVARGGVITAGGRPNPAFKTALGFNSTTSRDVITPWIADVALDIPIDVAGKRGIRIARARHLSEAARLNILSEAWRVRRRVRQAAMRLYAARQTDSLLTAEREIQTEIVAILGRQLTAGEVSAYETTQARVALAASRIAAVDASQARSRARSDLADAIGVPPVALGEVILSLRDLGRIVLDLPPGEIRRQALVNRSDILGGLLEYEASQSALQLEIRKQYPDFSLGPGYQLDQGEAKWTLGLGLILPLFNRNRGPIAEAQARREEAGARFLALQSKVLGELEGAAAASRLALEQVEAADRLLDELARQARAAATAYRVGNISRLELLGLQAQMAITARARLNALVQAQDAVGALEDAMQSPLDIGEWILETPQRAASRAASGGASER